ncbi:MAG: hypothetical protein JO255_12345 [Alphaproteobacteria bacterium]|nr:hypothetical protein [Alphaproteobacteria bacterium]
MSDLHAADDSAGDPGATVDPTAPQEPDNWLLEEFLEARALAQHVNLIAQLDAFAAVHDAGTIGDREAPQLSPGARTLPESDLGLAANDTMPFGLRVQLAAEKLAPIAAETPHLSGPERGLMGGRFGMGAGSGSPLSTAMLTPQDAYASGSAAQGATVTPVSTDAAPPPVRGTPSKASGGRDTIRHADDSNPWSEVRNEPLNLTGRTGVENGDSSQQAGTDATAEANDRGVQLAGAGDPCEGLGRAGGCQSGGSWGSSAMYFHEGRALCFDCAVKSLGIQEEPGAEKVRLLNPFLLE